MARTTCCPPAPRRWSSRMRARPASSCSFARRAASGVMGEGYRVWPVTLAFVLVVVVIVLEAFEYADADADDHEHVLVAVVDRLEGARTPTTPPPPLLGDLGG